MTTFNDLIDIANKAGIESQIKYDQCQANGGHYRDEKTTLNSKPAFECRCGFYAVITYPHWKNEKK